MEYFFIKTNSCKLKLKYTAITINNENNKEK